MISRAVQLSCLLALAILVPACKKDEPAPKAEASSAKIAKAPKVVASAQEDLSDVPVPTEEDFEEAADREITIDNLESELDRMEKDIGE